MNFRFLNCKQEIPNLELQNCEDYNFTKASVLDFVSKTEAKNVTINIDGDSRLLSLNCEIKGKKFSCLTWELRIMSKKDLATCERESRIEVILYGDNFFRNRKVILENIRKMKKVVPIESSGDYQEMPEWLPKTRKNYENFRILNRKYKNYINSYAVNIKAKNIAKYWHDELPREVIKKDGIIIFVFDPQEEYDSCGNQNQDYAIIAWPIN